jgi:hypothetical protein
VGVRWANLYRETRIQETVYEMLTQEYEIAKIQEAKEIPSVNLLDAPLLPERKSFPPRTVITGLGAALAFVLGAVSLIASAAWKRSSSPEKQLASEIWQHITSGESAGGSAVRGWLGKLNGRNGSNGRAA